MEHGGEAPGHIGRLVKAITPAMKRAKQQQGDLLDNAVKANIVLTRDQVTNSEPLQAAAVKAGKIKVVIRARRSVASPALRLTAAGVLAAATGFLLLGTYFFTTYYWGPAILNRLFS